MNLIKEPIQIGNKTGVTRIVFPPMATQGSVDGKPGRALTEHYSHIARNPNVGMITTEYGYISQQGKADPDQVSFASDDVIGAQEEMIKNIRAARPDILLIAQINHAGGNTSPMITGEELVGPSQMRYRGGITRELTQEEIREIERQFVQAALRVKRSGYDGVEIHSAHGYLLNEFYSPLTNRRGDRYGAGSIENRLRFLTETIDAVRDAVGKDFIVSARLGAADYMEGGSTIEDAVQAAVILEKHGIDMLSISGGLNGFVKPGDRSAGYFRDITEPIEKEVKIPVLLTGGVTRLSEAEELVEKGAADLIGIGRALFRNPALGV